MVSPRLRIGLFTLAYPPAVGGIATYVRLLGAALPTLGVDVRVFVRAAEPPASHPAEPVADWSRDLVAACRWADVAHMNGFWLGTAVAAVATRTPLVWTHHEYDTACPIGIAWRRGRSTSFSPFACALCMHGRGLAASIPRRFTLLFVRRAIARLAAANVAPTAYAGRRLALPRTTVVQHGVEGSAPRTSASPGAPRFVFAGRLTAEKGCVVLVDAAELVDRAGVPIRVDVLGDGPERAQLEGRAQRLVARGIMRFHGAVTEEQVRGFLRGCRALVVPSVWDEVAGFVALEAMAGAVPVIASRVGGLAEIADGCALLVERGSAELLAQAIARLASDEAEARRLGMRGLSRQQDRHTAPRMAVDHLALYRSVCGGAAR